MASIFTFDPSPPSVSSPWSTPRTSTPRLASNPGGTSPSPGLGGSSAQIPNFVTDSRSDSNQDVVVTSLEAEPQDGPTEYKLHLLLRPRREFMYSSTNGRVSGSIRTTSESPQLSEAPGLIAQLQTVQASSSSQTRQNRLEQLTTQLLWRLQQTSSYHYTTYKQTPVPSISLENEDPASNPVFPGLEDSKGALYEIGVADDGTFVGLAEDELTESLQTLSTMAASLGCIVSVLKKVAVGECQWVENSTVSGLDGLPLLSRVTKNSTLWVAEAYVRPNFGNSKSKLQKLISESEIEPQPLSVINQLRVTLTGATLSGKSSLLGTLTTATLDNGRGKSRLSLLKHQHEIATGMTSSVTHELLGYTAPDNNTGDVHVVNFASGNVTSWIDVHASCEDGRLVFFSDSAGHPRFRRTTVRGLIGWAPHWTLLCIPADTHEDSSGRLGNTPPSHETLGMPNLDLDLSQDHLELCLKLDIPLVIVMTKVDLASRTGLRSYLNKILSVLKRAGRQPFLLPDYSTQDMSTVATKDIRDVNKYLTGLKENPRVFVPIVLVSAVKGSGITTLHALLHELPTPSVQPNNPNLEDNSTALFDIEDTYNGRAQNDAEMRTIVLSGAVRYGRVSVGDELLVGPFQMKSSTSPQHRQNSRARPQLSSHYAAHSASPDPSMMSASAPSADHEWYKVRVCSARHLRLPTNTLAADQVGTLAVIPVDAQPDNAAWRAIRKGMVLTNGSPHAHRVFIAQFARRDVDPLSIGSAVVVYFNSVRASAKIVAGAITTTSDEINDTDTDTDDDDDNEESQEEAAFVFDEDARGSGRKRTPAVDDEQLLVTFRFLASREYVATGSRVLVMPGGAAGLYGGGSRGEKGIAGLNGFVGRVVDPSSTGYIGRV
jgi:GTPase